MNKEKEIILVKGGTVGRIESERLNNKEIAIQFKYQLDGNAEKIDSPVYIIDPWAARYAGWNLLRRGIMDGIKKKCKK